jgi:hypothetical protein
MRCARTHAAAPFQAGSQVAIVGRSTRAIRSVRTASMVETAKINEPIATWAVVI